MPAANQSPEQQRQSFEVWFRQAVSITFNIDCLQGLLMHAYAGNRALLKHVIGEDRIAVSRNSDASSDELKTDLFQQYLYVISILKALCAEMYLKALLASEHKTPERIHDLLSLYDALGFKNKGLLTEMLKIAIDRRMERGVKGILRPDFRAIMAFHQHDFVLVRYGETREHRDARLQDGMLNIDTALEALQLACMHQGGFSPWLQNEVKRFPDKL